MATDTKDTTDISIRDTIRADTAPMVDTSSTTEVILFLYEVKRANIRLGNIKGYGYRPSYGYAGHAGYGNHGYGYY